MRGRRRKIVDSDDDASQVFVSSGISSSHSPSRIEELALRTAPPPAVRYDVFNDHQILCWIFEWAAKHKKFAIASSVISSVPFNVPTELADAVKIVELHRLFSEAKKKECFFDFLHDILKALEMVFPDTKLINGTQPFRIRNEIIVQAAKEVLHDHEEVMDLLDTYLPIADVPAKTPIDHSRTNEIIKKIRESVLNASRLIIEAEGIHGLTGIKKDELDAFEKEHDTESFAFSFHNFISKEMDRALRVSSTRPRIPFLDAVPTFLERLSRESISVSRITSEPERDHASEGDEIPSQITKSKRGRRHPSKRSVPLPLNVAPDRKRTIDGSDTDLESNLPSSSSKKSRIDPLDVLLQRQENAETVEWDDGDDELQNIRNQRKNIPSRLPSRIRSKSSELRKRSFRRWSQEEEDWVREGVARFGIGNWKQILLSYPFNARTAVNLKDKWRNIMAKDRRELS